MKPEAQNSLAKTEDLALDEESVADYLLSHPDFFINHEDLLLKLRIPHESGQAVSLLERQVSVLRTRNDDSRNKINDFIANAKENDALFEKTRTIILSIINSGSLKELSDVIANKLKQEFSASDSKLFFASENSDQETSLHLLPLEYTRKVLGKLFERKRAFCGSLDENQTQLFFPEAKNIKSVAIIPIHLHDENELKTFLPGNPILVITSNKSKHFNSSLDTLFLDFIGEVVSAHMRNLASKS